MNASLVPVAKSVLIVTTLASALWVSAGSLTPPPGPITPTMKDLDDVEPRIAIRNDFDTLTPVQITFPGSYYLAEDILALPGRDGIEILTSNVTLDLNGFMVQGNLEVGSLAGIKVTGNRSNIAVQNGVVRDFFDEGLNFSTAERTLIEQVRSLNNGEHGMLLGRAARVNHCIASGNGDDGISAGEWANISHSVATNNSDHGILVLQGSVVTNCVGAGNAGTGIIGNNATIEHCTGRENGSGGISGNASNVLHCNSSFNTGNGMTALASYLFGNISTNNTQAGIFLSTGGSRIDSNSVRGNAAGISTGSGGNVIIRNSADTNSGNNYSIGVGNDVGPIGTAAASTSPWANISN